MIWHKEFGDLRASGRSANFTHDLNNIFDKCTLYINPLSDKISILNGVVASPDTDGYCLTLMKPIQGIQSSHEGELSTDYSSIYVISAAHTELFDQISEQAREMLPKTMLTV